MIYKLKYEVMCSQTTHIRLIVSFYNLGCMYLISYLNYVSSSRFTIKNFFPQLLIKSISERGTSICMFIAEYGICGNDYANKSTAKILGKFLYLLYDFHVCVLHRLRNFLSRMWNNCRHYWLKHRKCKTLPLHLNVTRSQKRLLFMCHEHGRDIE